MSSHRRFTEPKIIVASHNEGKVREIRDLLAPFGVETVSAAELDLPEPEETGTTFTANAEIKARAAAEATGLPALADDSGIEVAALGVRHGDLPALRRTADLSHGAMRLHHPACRFDLARAVQVDLGQLARLPRQVEQPAEVVAHDVVLGRRGRHLHRASR